MKHQPFVEPLIKLQSCAMYFTCMDLYECSYLGSLGIPICLIIEFLHLIYKQIEIKNWKTLADFSVGYTINVVFMVCDVCFPLRVHQRSNLAISHVDLMLTLQNPALQKQTATITCPPTKTLLHQGPSTLWTASSRSRASMTPHPHAPRWRWQTPASTTCPGVTPRMFCPRQRLHLGLTPKESNTFSIPRQQHR